MQLSVEIALAEHEQVIEHGLKNFIEVGNALLAIRDGKLYQQGHKTFEDYCRVRWNIARSHANRLMDAAKVMENLSPTGDKPATERHIRPLASLEPAEQAEAWKEAVETAPDGVVTAAHVEEVVARRKSDNWVPTQADTESTEELSELVVADKKYGCIYADPPWQYGNQATRAATDNHYPTMTIDEIAALPVGELAAERSHLWLWTTNGFLFECPKLFEAWGFEFKSSYIWAKTQMGIGNYLRNSHEFLLLAVRGGLTAAARNVMSWGEFPRGKHSVKPENIRTDVIEKISPGPRLELFGRKVTDGWTTWGNQISKTMFDKV